MITLPARFRLWWAWKAWLVRDPFASCSPFASFCSPWPSSWSPWAFPFLASNRRPEQPYYCHHSNVGWSPRTTRKVCTTWRLAWRHVRCDSHCSVVFRLGSSPSVCLDSWWSKECIVSTKANATMTTLDRARWPPRRRRADDNMFAGGMRHHRVHSDSKARLDWRGMHTQDDSGNMCPCTARAAPPKRRAEYSEYSKLTILNRLGHSHNRQLPWRSACLGRKQTHSAMSPKTTPRGWMLQALWFDLIVAIINSSRRESLEQQKRKRVSKKSNVPKGGSWKIERKSRWKLTIIESHLHWWWWSTSKRIVATFFFLSALPSLYYSICSFLVSKLQSQSEEKQTDKKDMYVMDDLFRGETRVLANSLFHLKLAGHKNKTSTSRTSAKHIYSLIGNDIMCNWRCLHCTPH